MAINIKLPIMWLFLIDNCEGEYGILAFVSKFSGTNSLHSR